MARICLAILAIALLGCPGTVIENATPDATPLPPDAMIPPNHLALACSNDLTAPIACPAGWECLTQKGGNGDWCTKSCTGQSDPSCDLGYTGPGYGACILAPPEGGGLKCAVVCSDPAGAPTICPEGTTCNGTCVDPLECTGVITDANQVQVGASCQ